MKLFLFAKKLSSVVVIKLSARLLGMVVAVCLARMMGVEDFGVYSYVVAIVTVVSIPVQIGLPQLVVRETAKAQVAEAWSLMAGLWRWASLAVLSMSITVLLIAILTWLIFGLSTDTVDLSVVVIALVLIPLIALGNIRGAALRGLRFVVVGQIPEFIIKPFSFIFFLILVYYFGGTHLSVKNAFILNLVSAAVAFIVGISLLRRYSPKQIYSLQNKYHYKYRYWLKSLLPFAIMGGIQVVDKQTDILMLGLIGEMKEVAVYKIVVTGASLVVFGLSAANMVFSPHFARLYEQKEYEKLQALVTDCARVIMLISVPAALVVILFGSEMLEILFGKEYKIGYPALIILVVSQLVNATFGPVGFLLNMTGHEADTTKIVAVGAIINVVLNALLIPAYGINGAAIATMISVFTWNLLLCRKVWIKLNINSTVFKFSGKVLP